MGGGGDDTYIIDNSKDVIVDASGDDNSIISTITIDLNNTAYDGIERVTLSGTGNLNATGDDAANILIGNAGANKLDGRAGNDVMIGGAGGDFYEVDDSSDSLVELSGEGIDQVNSAADFELADHLENLTLTGTGDIDGTGNDLANRITGNAGANLLRGAGLFDLLDGNDSLFGNGGDDTLEGGLGADSMVGGLGSDTYIVLDAGDRVVEGNEAGAIDTVLSFMTYTLGANVENLLLVDNANVNGNGNTLANVITGQTGDNVLSGLAGNDTLDGAVGADLLLGGDGTDRLNLSLGTDTLVGGSRNDTFAINSPFNIGGLDEIADFSATVNGDILDFGDVLTGYDPGSSNINDFIQCVTTSDGTKIRVDTDGGGDSFVDLVTLVGVTTDITGLLNNGNLVLVH